MNASVPVIAQASVSARLGLSPGVIVGYIFGMLHAFMVFLPYEFDTKWARSEALPWANCDVDNENLFVLSWSYLGTGVMLFCCSPGLISICGGWVFFSVLVCFNSHDFSTCLLPPRLILYFQGDALCPLLSSVGCFHNSVLLEITLVFLEPLSLQVLLGSKACNTEIRSNRILPVMKSWLRPTVIIKQKWPNSASHPLNLGLDKGKCLKTSK